MSINTIVRQSKDYELIAASWHEASHTICGLFNFIKVYKVYVCSDKQDNGKTLYESYDAENFNDKLLSKILSIYEAQTLYAGLIGEKIYYKEICGSDNFPMHLRIGSSQDIEAISKLIDKHKLASPGKPRSLLKKQLKKYAESVLVDHWADVRLLSHILYKHKELNFDELQYFLTRNSKEKDFWKCRFKEIKKIYAPAADLEEDSLKEILLQNSILIF